MVVEVIDSHTGGEPTRVVLAGGPDLGNGSLRERRERFKRDFDAYRSAIVNEPRGSDAMVGALLCQPQDPSCAAGVIFFNNVGYLNMCGHGTIGLVVTLAHRRLIRPGLHNIETPAGIVTVFLDGEGAVTIRNVPSYRLAARVPVEVDRVGTVTGDIAWGGNWFFLMPESPIQLDLANVEVLTDYARRVRRALQRSGVTGENGQEIDHIELFGPARRPDADARNFVLCPGGAYDRSPCGTGTSAKLACLVADGKLGEGQTWRQESIVGSLFEGRVEIRDGQIYPLIRGTAHVSAEAKLVLDEHDPFCWGIPLSQRLDSQS
jgi:4-hydroxyproline epimerase